jgi:hypothetical protein
LEPDLFLADDQFYTVIPTGVGGYHAMFLEDDRTPPPAGQFRFRFVGAAAGAPAFDVYIASPNDNLEQLTAVLSNVTFEDVTGFLNKNIGNYEVVLTFAGTKEVFLNTGLLTFFDGQVRTILLVDAPGGGAPYSLLFLQDIN